MINMGKVDFLWLCFGFIFSAVSVNGQTPRLYLTTAEINVTLPDSATEVKREFPPLLELLAAGDEETEGVEYEVVKETTPGMVVVEGNVLRVNEEALKRGDMVSKRHSAVVSGRGGLGGAEGQWGASGGLRINLVLGGDKINCGRAKRNLCFWDGALYRIEENRPPTQLGQLSSRLFRDFCTNYSLSYSVYEGGDFVGVDRGKNPNEWILSTRRGLTLPPNGGLHFGVNCTVSSPEGPQHFQNEFHLLVDEREPRLEMEILHEVSPSNIIEEDETIARGTVSNIPGDVDIFLSNDTEGFLRLKCLPRDQQLPGKSSYDCDVTAKKQIQLFTPYTVVLNVVGDKLHHSLTQNITLHPRDPGLEKMSLMLSTHPGDNFLLDVKYPEWVEVSRKAVVGTRVAEPLVGDVGGDVESRRRIVKGKIMFEVMSPGPLNVTREGGIVYVARRNDLKEAVYRVKISGVYPNGYRFISTMQVNVTETVEDSCGRSVDDGRVSCSEKRFKSECEKTCGVSSGMVRRNGGRAVTVGCVWRSNEKPEKLSRMYQTCSPDLSTCPDRFCDPLEVLFPKICPQDCTEYVFGSANKENHLPGIASATGVCSCDNRQKCLCSLFTKSDVPRQPERKKPPAHDTPPPQYKEAISAVKASYTDQCGLLCLLSIVGGSLILIFGMSALLLFMHRRRLKKRCPNQRPLKEDMVNINYEDYVERPGDVLRPLNQTAAMKEIPEYFDKKWEFPRHRLTIEETIGEGEFGKVLKARADGIGGYDGSITVAVKTLKDNAKESELADLISEYQLLKEIDHPNVIHLLGACTKLDGPLYIIIEYAKHGSLRNYLRKHRGEDGVTPKDILTFAWQIAKGMSYLTEMKLVHRDLAARNVLVAEGLICKISDFGLTRDIYEDDTYLKRSKGRVPVKWMALESLADHVYTTKSDVWSYGVVLWELVTTGASPYPGIAGQDLFNLLKSGYRMEKPANCSIELYQILRSCWHESPSHRPTFKSLVAKLEEMLGEGKEYLDLNPRTAENKTYFSEFPVGGEEGEGMFAVEFKMFERGRCGGCNGGECVCGVKLRYENESVVEEKKKKKKKKRYENEGMEDSGYVQPTGRPKRVGDEGMKEES